MYDRYGEEHIRNTEQASRLIVTVLEVVGLSALPDDGQRGKRGFRPLEVTRRRYAAVLLQAQSSLWQAE